MVRTIIVNQPVANNDLCCLPLGSLITWVDILLHSSQYNKFDKWGPKSPFLSPSDSSVEILNVGDLFCILTNNDIVRVEENAGESILYLASKEFITTTASIAYLESVLANHKFFRVHSNHLINLNHLSNFVRCDAFVTLTSSEAIPVDMGKDRMIIKYLEGKYIV